MPIRMIPVDVTALGPTLALGMKPKLDFDTQEQKVTKEGLPQWSATVFVASAEESIAVTIAAKEKPAAPAPGQPVELVGLEAGTYATPKGSAFYYVAAGIKAVQRGN